MRQTNAPFTCIRFHSKTQLFCRVSAYSLHVNEQNALGKCCVWKTHFKIDRSKKRSERHRVNMKNEETLLLIGEFNEYARITCTRVIRHIGRIGVVSAPALGSHASLLCGVWVPKQARGMRLWVS